MDKKSEIVVGLPRHRVNKKLFIGLAVVTVLGVTGCAMWYWMSNSADRSAATSHGQLTNDELDKAISQAYAKNDYASATKLIESQKTIEDPAVQLKLALAYANQGAYKSSLAVFDKLEKAGKLSSTYQATAADVALAANDKTTCLRYLRLAVAKLKSEGSPSAEDQTKVYEKKIANLEQK